MKVGEQYVSTLANEWSRDPFWKHPVVRARAHQKNMCWGMRHVFTRGHFVDDTFFYNSLLRLLHVNKMTSLCLRFGVDKWRMRARIQRGENGTRIEKKKGACVFKEEGQGVRGNVVFICVCARAFDSFGFKEKVARECTRTLQSKLNRYRQHIHAHVYINARLRIQDATQVARQADRCQAQEGECCEAQLQFVRHLYL